MSRAASGAVLKADRLLFGSHLQRRLRVVLADMLGFPADDFDQLVKLLKNALNIKIGDIQTGFAGLCGMRFSMAGGGESVLLQVFAAIAHGEDGVLFVCLCHGWAPEALVDCLVSIEVVNLVGGVCLSRTSPVGSPCAPPGRDC